MFSDITWRVSTASSGQLVTCEGGGIMKSTPELPEVTVVNNRIASYETWYSSNALSEQRKELESGLIALRTENELLRGKITSLCQDLARNRTEMLHNTLRLEDLLALLQSTSPQSLLPPEILAEIFLRTLPSGTESDFGNLPRVSSRSPLIAITHVSSSWRSIAIRTPKLWNRICFEYTAMGGDMDDADRRANLLSLWLERSHPLDVHLSLIPRYQLCSPRPLPFSTFDAIAPHSNRIRRLSLHAPVKKVLQPILHPFEGEGMGFASLQALQIVMDQADAISVHLPVTGFKGCQSLTQVSLDIKPPQPGALEINWGQLTVLDMLKARQPLNRGRWIHMIRFCPRLKTGKFFLTSRHDLALHDVHILSGHSSAIPSLQEIFHMGDLEELIIEYEGVDSISSLLNNLSFGRVKHFELHAEPGQQYALIEDRVNLGSWNRLAQLATLRSLNLSGIQVLPDNLMLFLSTLSFIEDLRLDVAGFDSDVLLSSLRREGESLCLPQLQHLSLRVPHFNPDARVAYLDVVQSRTEYLQSTTRLFHILSIPPSFSMDLYFRRTNTYLDALGASHFFELNDDDPLLPQISVHHVSPHTRL